MGATNEIKGTNISLQLEDKQCPQCQQVFTKQEIDDRNFDIWFDTSNDVELKPISEVKDNNLYFPSQRTGYYLSIWIRSIEHEYCPDTEICKRCDEKLLTEKMKEFKGDYYCSPCYKQISKDHE